MITTQEITAVCSIFGFFAIVILAVLIHKCRDGFKLRHEIERNYLNVKKSAMVRKVLKDDTSTKLRIHSNGHDIESANSSDVCPICLSQFIEGQEIASSKNPACLHEFHFECILKWLITSSHYSCPSCRLQLIPDSITEKSEDTLAAESE